MKILIVILNWNGWRDTLKCLDSIYNSFFTNFNVVIMDNGSKNESTKQIKKWANLNNVALFENNYNKQLKQRDILLIKSKFNMGYAQGNNIAVQYGLKYCNPEWIFLLNNDTVIRNNFLQIMKNELAFIKSDVVGTAIYYINEPNKAYSCGKNFSLFLPHANMKGRSSNLCTKKREVDVISGCAFFVKTKTWKSLNGFDNKFFAYYEEIDLFIRMKKKGKKIFFLPIKGVYHKGGASSGGEEAPIINYYKLRNLLYLMRKHAKFYHWIIFLPYYFAVWMKKCLYYLFKKEISSVLSITRGVTDGWKL